MCQSVYIPGALPDDRRGYDSLLHTVPRLNAALPHGVAYRAGTPPGPMDDYCTCWVDFPATAERNGYIAIRSHGGGWAFLAPEAHAAREAALEAIDDAVDRWHSGEAEGSTLRDFLGMSAVEYAAWVERCEVSKGYEVPERGQA